jgi:predicted alpha/beta superfamily hydrolase
MLGGNLTPRVVLVTSLIFGAAITASSLPRRDASVEELKGRLSSTSIGDRPELCLEIANKQLDAADKLYAAVESEKAQATLAEVTAFAELARDYAIQSHKHQKQTEIAVRKMIRRIEDIKRTVSHEEQPPLQEAVDRLQHVRTDLLFSMFPHAQKGDQ